MIPLFHIGFLTVTLSDVLDILIVAAVFYKILQLLRGTRAFPMFVGLLLLFLLAFLAQVVQLQTLGFLIGNFQAVWLIAFVILFAPELRRLLASMGQSRFVRYFVKMEEPHVVDEVAAACERMSRKGIGALIVISRQAGLKGLIDTGVKLSSEVSAPLLETVFFPRSPLHDGAVIIQNGIIEAASCLLPLSQDPQIETALGTRHRAAVGVTEESDAVAVVVSEESSVISLAVGGGLLRNLDGSSLRERLSELLGLRRPAPLHHPADRVLPI